MDYEEDDSFSCPAHEAIFSVLDTLLKYPADTDTRVAEIAKIILLAGTYAEPGISTEDLTCAIWQTLCDSEEDSPPGNELFQILAVALTSIRPWEGTPGEVDKHHWEYLSQVSVFLTEQWEYVPLEEHENLTELALLLIKWKNLNSFVSHLVDCGFIQQLVRAFWEIRRALELPAIKGPIMDCRVWVVTEYILNCGNVLFRKMKAPEEEIGWVPSSFLQPGPVYGVNLEPRSLRRWEFWKKRLAEISRSDNLGLEDETKKRVTDALKVMELQS